MHPNLTRTGRALLAGAMLAATFAAVAPAAPAAAAPAAPAGLSPSGSIVDSNPVLSWRAVSGATRYSVQAATESTFATTVYNASTTSTRATPSSNLPTGAIFWRVAAVDGAGVSSSWSEASFTRSALAGPTPLTPADGETLAFPGQPPVFSWGALAGVSSYTLEIDDAPDFVSPTSYTTVNTSFVLNTPQPAGQSYYWRVQGVTKDRLVTAFSATRSYQTEPVAKPQPDYPGNTTEPAIKDVVISWKPVAGAVSYHLQVSPNVDFTNNTTDVLSVKGTRWSPDKTLNNGSY